MTTCAQLIHLARRTLWNWFDEHDLEQEKPDVLDTLLRAEAYADNLERQITQLKAEVLDLTETLMLFVTPPETTYSPAWAGTDGWDDPVCNMCGEPLECDFDTDLYTCDHTSDCAVVTAWKLLGWKVPDGSE